MLEMRGLVQTVIDQARAGDEGCGYFLAELTAFLWKNREKLGVHNEAFRKNFSTLESARVTSRKSSPLRPLIQKIISETCVRRRQLSIAHASRLGQFFPDREGLLKLPEFGPSAGVAREWATKVVYPRLQLMEAELARDPEMAKIKKAWGLGGSFRISRLKVQINETVVRIAALPRSYFFNIA